MRHKRYWLAILAVVVAVSIVLSSWISPYPGIASEDYTAEIQRNRTTLSGGELATVEKITQTAFAQPITNLDRARRRIFSFGDHLFNTQWVQAPASVATLDGLGPLFNRNSCAGCHVRDGRGRPPLPDETRMLSMLVRLSVPGQNDRGGPLPHPVYGGQFQEQGILGVAAEGETKISWTEEPGQFADGQAFNLRRPAYEFTNLGYGPLGEDMLFSPRVAPPVFGLGLLENIPEESIVQQADPDDRDGDGISGRPNWVWDVRQQETRLGRFGLKASEPNIKQQIADAFNGDIGITSSLKETSSCTEFQVDCQEKAQLGDRPDVSDVFLDKITTYVSLLAVPARRNLDGATEQRGERLFYQAQCATCHLPRLVTGNASEHPEFNDVVIHPYTDLLLHDMGADLADNRPDFEADGQEWRTPPLWGIGLVENVNKHTFFLHDGRARNFAEAILWHGGEAEQSKEQFVAMEEGDREALVQFLNSL